MHLADVVDTSELDSWCINKASTDGVGVTTCSMLPVLDGEVCLRRARPVRWERMATLTSSETGSAKLCSARFLAARMLPGMLAKVPMAAAATLALMTGSMWADRGLAGNRVALGKVEESVSTTGKAKSFRAAKYCPSGTLEAKEVETARSVPTVAACGGYEVESLEADAGFIVPAGVRHVRRPLQHRQQRHQPRPVQPKISWSRDTASSVPRSGYGGSLDGIDLPARAVTDAANIDHFLGSAPPAPAKGGIEQSMQQVDTILNLLRLSTERFNEYFKCQPFSWSTCVKYPLLLESHFRVVFSQGLLGRSQVGSSAAGTYARGIHTRENNCVLRY
jgi:hypothetical protein